MTLFFFRKTIVLVWVLGFIISIILISLTIPVAYENVFGGLIYYRGVWGPGVEVTHVSAAMAYCVLLAFIADIAVIIFVEIIAKIVHKRTVAVLYEDCNAPRFLELYLPVLKRVENHKRFLSRLIRKDAAKGPSRLYAYLYYAQGLFESGNVKQAIATLEGVARDKGMEMNASIGVKCKIHLELMQYYFYIGDIDAAAYSFETIKRGCNASRTARLQYYDKNISEYLQKAEAVNQFYNNGYREVIEYFNPKIERAKSNLKKARAQCYLALSYAALGESSYAEEHMKQAIQKAPMLYSVLQAKKKLDVA